MVIKNKKGKFESSAGEILKKFREKKGETKTELARKAHIDSTYISHIEGGRKQPSELVLRSLADALELVASERSELFAAMINKPGHSTSNRSIQVSVIEKAVNRTIEVLNDNKLRVEEREQIAAALYAFIDQRKDVIEKNKKRVSKALIPIAGWQSRLLATGSMRRIVHYALKEIDQAHIRDVIIILAPINPGLDVARLKPDFPKLRIRTIDQEQQQGLGHAIKITQGLIGEEPFAVVLPDDIDPTGKTLGKMVENYSQVRESMIAVMSITTPESESNLKYYGVAFLESTHKRNGRHPRIKGLVEKPVGAIAENSRAIMGRYILTPEIFSALEETNVNEQTGSQELTDALSTLLNKGQHLCVYEPNHPFCQIKPLSKIIDKYIHLLEDQDKFQAFSNRIEQLLEVG